MNRDAREEWFDNEKFWRETFPFVFSEKLFAIASFGYFEDRNDDLRVLANAYRSLKPGGALFMDVMGKEHLARTFIPTHSYTLPNGSAFVEIHKIIDDWSRLQNDYIVIKKNKALRFRFYINLYSGLELRERWRRRDSPL